MKFFFTFLFFCSLRFLRMWYQIFGFFSLAFFMCSDLKEIAAHIETGAYTREVRRIVRAVRLTMALRQKLKSSALGAFLNFALAPGSEVHSRLSSYLPKVILGTTLLKFLGFLPCALMSCILYYARFVIVSCCNFALFLKGRKKEKKKKRNTLKQLADCQLT